MSVSTIVTKSGEAYVSDAAGRLGEFVIPTKFQVSSAKSSFSKTRTINTRGPILYEGQVTEYVLKDPFTVSMMCNIPFTPREDGDLNIGEVYLLAETTDEGLEHLHSLSQPTINTSLTKPPMGILTIEVVLHTQGMAILDAYNFKNVLHKGNVCDVQKLRDLLEDGVGIKTTVTPEGKLRIDADFDHLEV